MTTTRHKESARRLLKSLRVPTWAVSVMAWGENEAASLVVLIDPVYRLPIEVPEEFEGYKVIWRDREQAVSNSI